MGTSANRLLKGLSQADRVLLGRSLEEVALTLRDKLEMPETASGHVYFIETGMVSSVATAQPNHRIEVGMTGFEGMVGISLILGVGEAANEALVQTPGTAWRITAADFEDALRLSLTLRPNLLRYVKTFSVQTAQTALANGRGKLDQRLARWLLMWSDRLRGRDLPITHEFLALLLGVRRQSATTTLHELEGRQLIRSERGIIHLRNRPGLLLVAAGFYGVPEDEYDRIMSTSSADARSPRRAR